MSDEELASARAAYLAAGADVWAAGRATLPDALAARDAAIDRYRSAGAAYLDALDVAPRPPETRKPRRSGAP